LSILLQIMANDVMSSCDFTSEANDLFAI